MNKYLLVILSALVFTFAAFGQPVAAPSDAYMVRYAGNLLNADSFVNLTNTGVNGGYDPAGTICANVYVFDPAQELVACCTCPLTPMHLKTLSAKNDLVVKTLTPGVPTAITVALLGSKGTCNASTVTAANLVGGLRAWMTTPHATPGSANPVTYQLTETEFSQSVLDATMLSKLTTYCGFIQANGSGYGICNSCKQGAQGPAKN